MQISKISEEKYQLKDGEDKIVFSREKFEDLYYAVPLNSTAFLRLLQDNVCANNDQRHALNAMLDRASERSIVLGNLQKQIQSMDYDNGE